VNGPEIAQKELAEIRDARACEVASVAELLRPGWRRALVLALGLAIFGQLTGVNIVVYYGPTVLEAAGLGLGGALQSQVLFGVINLLATLIAIWKVDRWGRRPLLIWGMALVTAAMTLTAVLLLSQAPAIWIVFLLCVYMGCVSVSICAVIWVLIPEVFPTRIRGRAVSIATFAVWATNTVSTLVFPWYVEACGVDAGFFTFAALCVAATIFFWHLVPETKGKSLEEIERQWLHRSQRSQHAQQGLLLLLVTAACGGVAATSAQPKDLQAPVLPAEAWVKATPESQGMSTAKLDALRDQSCPPLAAVSTPLSPGQAQNEIGPKGFLVPDGYSGLRVRELKPR
jgi:MFS family permease